MNATKLELCLLISLALMGCASKSKLVGTWEAEGLGPNSMKGTLITFNADNTYSSVMMSRLAGGTITMSGTYTLEGEKLTLRIESVAGVNDKFQKSGDGASDTMTLEWRSDHEIVVVSSTGKSVMKRKS